MFLNRLDEQGKTYVGINYVSYSIMAIQSDTYLGRIFFCLIQHLQIKALEFKTTH